MNQQGTGGVLMSGVRVGVPVAIPAVIVTALYDAGVVPGWVQAIEFLIALAAFIYAGVVTARATRKVMTGTLAGVVCSLFAAVVILGANVVMVVVAPAQFARAFGYHDVSNGVLLAAAVTQSLIGLVVWAFVGFICGAIGGWFGSRRKQVEAQPAG